MKIYLRLQFWIVCGHSVTAVSSLADNQLLVYRQIYQGFFMMFLTNMPFAVDTFFMLGSFLSTYLFLVGLNKKKAPATGAPAVASSSFVPWLGLTYLHRYLRLTPLYFVVLMFDAFVMKYMAQGPLWGQFMVSFAGHNHMR